MLNFRARDSCLGESLTTGQNPIIARVVAFDNFKKCVNMREERRRKWKTQKLYRK